jgi:hypothetical protein
MAIDWGRLEAVLTEALVDFRAGVDARTVSRRQELRSLMILWFASFLPEAFTSRFEKSLRAAVVDLRARSDYPTNVWYQVVPLEAALFAVTDERTWVLSAVANLNHHDSSLRSFVNEGLAFVVDRLSFQDAELRSRVEQNIRFHQGGCEDTFLMLLSARGEPTEKREVVEAWKGRPELERIHALCKGLQANGFVENSLAVGFSDTLVYTLIEMTQFPPGEQLPLNGIEGLRPRETQILRGLDVWKTIWDRWHAHPLTGLLFELNR